MGDRISKVPVEVINALAEAAKMNDGVDPAVVRFAKKANITLQLNKKANSVFLREKIEKEEKAWKKIRPTPAPHGGGVGGGTLRAAHNNPGSR